QHVQRVTKTGFVYEEAPYTEEDVPAIWHQLHGLHSQPPPPPATAACRYENGDHEMTRQRRRPSIFTPEEIFFVGLRERKPLCGNVELTWKRENLGHMSAQLFCSQTLILLPYAFPAAVGAGMALETRYEAPEIPILQ